MAGLEDLTAMIYHERQQEGSMLCAQHALNSLLQGNYFTAPDLASIANSFDALERDAIGEGLIPDSSGNMDDTGFFSVQVMDKALDVWGLDLLRWRSPQMRPYHGSPHKQLAFVLNLHQHWFTLRRFGPATSNFETDAGDGVWFNLNSQYRAPKWVSRTYLGMFLQQSEEEGYSVFAVVQHDRTQPLALPRTEADQAAALLEAPDALPGHSSSTSMPGSFPGSTGRGGSPSDEPEQIVIPEDMDYDVANEDVELQAALAASLTGAGGVSGPGAEYGGFEQHAYVPQAPVPAPNLRQAPDAPEIDANEDADPIAASAARSRALLEQMQRIQEAALREGYQEDDGAAQIRRTREQEEAAELERALAESMQEHGGSGPRPEASRDIPGSAGVSTPRAAAGGQHRVYDDEDSELQAALRASLESMPEGYVHSTPPPVPPPSRPAAQAELQAQAQPEAEPASSTRALGTTEADESTSTETEEERAPVQEVDKDEMRRRRLARFGG